MSPRKRTPPAERRRAYHTARIAAEPTLRRKLHRAGDWLVAEVIQLPDREKPAVLARLTEMVTELNERNARVDGQ